MGRYDDAMYRYLSDNDRFADLFNAVFFGGKKVLRGEQLEPDGERYAAGLPKSSWEERMAKEDRIHPVYTICFYHGTKKWNGPRSLRDMMEFPEGADTLWKEYFHDYGMTLFCADEPGELGRFGTELKQLLKVLKLRQDKEALLQLWEQEEFSHIDRDTAEVIAVLTDSTEILDKLEDYENKDEGGYSMCLAVNEMRMEWKAEGIIETALDFGLSESAILERLQQKLNVPLEKAQEYFAMFGKQLV